MKLVHAATVLIVVAGLVAGAACSSQANSGETTKVASGTSARAAAAPVTAASAGPDTIVLMPAGVPHAVSASEPSRMLLIMLREPRT
jgi:hypothetical protein